VVVRIKNRGKMGMMGRMQGIDAVSAWITSYLINGITMNGEMNELTVYLGLKVYQLMSYIQRNSVRISTMALYF
jgi:hypothetical protein